MSHSVLNWRAGPYWFFLSLFSLAASGDNVRDARLRLFGHVQRGYVTAARQEGQRKTSESSDVVKKGMWRVCASEEEEDGINRKEAAESGKINIKLIITRKTKSCSRILIQKSALCCRPFGEWALRTEGGSIATVKDANCWKTPKRKQFSVKFAAAVAVLIFVAVDEWELRGIKAAGPRRWYKLSAHCTSVNQSSTMALGALGWLDVSILRLRVNAAWARAEPGQLA